MNRKQKTGSIALLMLAEAAGTLGAYFWMARPRVVNWGATREETGQALPGDETVVNPRYIVNHGVTIDAPASTVWPWLLRIGQGRYRFHGKEPSQNATGCKTSSPVMPELQNLKAGDRIWLAEEYFADLCFDVASIDPEKSLVLITPGSQQGNVSHDTVFGTWTFVLKETGKGKTRLITRMRSDFKPRLANVIWDKYVLEVLHWLLERKTLLGIKRRSEKSLEPPKEAVPGCYIWFQEAEFREREQAA